MPELPEVETVRRGLDTALAGATIDTVRLTRPDLRLPFPKNMAQALAGRTIASIERRAKYLIWRLDSGKAILSHLGMSGCFIVRSTPQKLKKHDHIELRLSDGRQVLYHDPRRFGLVTLVANDDLPSHPLLSELGPEPLEKAFNSTYLKRVLTGRMGPIKAVLMDQKVVVGVGNIYASEALFLTGIHPLRPADKCIAKAPDMVKAIQQVLKDAIASGGSSLRDFVDISGDSGYFQHAFKVYGQAKKPCSRCDGIIENIRIAGRSSFFCPNCQD